MRHQGIALKKEQRRRLVSMAGDDDRSMNYFIGRLIDLEWETRAAYKERSTATDGAQNPEPITVTITK